MCSADTENYAKVADSHGCYAMHHFILNLPKVHFFLAFQTKFLLMKLPDLVAGGSDPAAATKISKNFISFLKYFLNNFIMFLTLFQNFLM